AFLPRIWAKRHPEALGSVLRGIFPSHSAPQRERAISRNASRRPMSSSIASAAASPTSSDAPIAGAPLEAARKGSAVCDGSGGPAPRVFGLFSYGPADVVDVLGALSQAIRCARI